jgi:hypothetical protein
VVEEQQVVLPLRQLLEDLAVELLVQEQLEQQQQPLAGHRFIMLQLHPVE